ncbi:hypothetical protein Daus18300_009633 [Diaporthe australafricana]|uniref:Suppressor of anucleate metulae protein B n=1 Tax=Diaporthe australafricana TaxID=127596 RepID=A0ABR3WE55_9PEZI
MAASQRKPIHDQPKLCDHILSRVAKSDVSLRVGQSLIPKAGSGLFAVNDIAAGSEIFRSHPLIMVSESAHQDICDFCFLNSNSSVNGDGRFYTPSEDDSRPRMAPCAACRVAYYCSKKCQAKAWKSYHKYECAVLQQNPDLGSVQQALCRLLFWIKKSVISAEDMRVIMALETEFEARMERARRAGSDGVPEFDMSLEVASNLHSAMNPGISLNECRQLYCAIGTNALAIRPSEVEAAYGTCLDLVVSLINHCCDENAFIFFEGRELRCRAVKDMAAGTEITVCYQGARENVLHRRRTLRNLFYFSCDCCKCKSEMAEHVAAAVNRQNHLDILRTAQDDLNKLEYKYTTAISTSANPLKTIMEYQTKLLDIEQDVYQGGNWPDHIEPMPSALRALGCMYLDLKYIVGLEFVLKGTFYSRNHAGLRWVIDLTQLVKYMIYLSQVRDESLNWTGSGPPEVMGGRITMQEAARGYMIIVCLSGSFAFGVNTKFVRALYNWAGNILERPGAHNVDTEEFIERFKESQDKLLTWAKMKTSRGLELPSKDTIARLRRDIADVDAGGHPKVDE